MVIPSQVEPDFQPLHLYDHFIIMAIFVAQAKAHAVIFLSEIC